MVKKLGSGGFASVFLLSNQVPLFLSQTFNSNFKNIKSFRIPDPTFCLQRQMVGSMQPNTKRRAITRKNGALGQRWPCYVGWNPAGVDRQTFAVSDLFLFLVLFFFCFFCLCVWPATQDGTLQMSTCKQWNYKTPPTCFLLSCLSLQTHNWPGRLLRGGLRECDSDGVCWRHDQHIHYFCFEKFEIQVWIKLMLQELISLPLFLPCTMNSRRLSVGLSSHK